MCVCIGPSVSLRSPCQTVKGASVISITAKGLLGEGTYILAYDVTSWRRETSQNDVRWRHRMTSWHQIMSVWQNDYDIYAEVHQRWGVFMLVMESESNNSDAGIRINLLSMESCMGYSKILLFSKANVYWKEQVTFLKEIMTVISFSIHIYYGNNKKGECPLWLSIVKVLQRFASHLCYFHIQTISVWTYHTVFFWHIYVFVYFQLFSELRTTHQLQKLSTVAQTCPHHLVSLIQ